MEFLVNGEVKELNIYDDNGINWVADLIGDSLSRYHRDEKMEMFVMPEDDYNWWDEYISNYNADAKEIENLKREYDISTDEMNELLIEALQYTDMGYHHCAKQQLFDRIREERAE